MRFPCSPEPKEGGKSLEPVEVAVWRLRVFSTSPVWFVSNFEPPWKDEAHALANRLLLWKWKPFSRPWVLLGAIAKLRS